VRARQTPMLPPMAKPSSTSSHATPLDGGRSASDDPKKYEHAADPPDDIAIRTPEEKP